MHACMDTCVFAQLLASRQNDVSQPTHWLLQSSWNGLIHGRQGADFGRLGSCSTSALERPAHVLERRKNCIAECRVAKTTKTHATKGACTARPHGHLMQRRHACMLYERGRHIVDSGICNQRCFGGPATAFTSLLPKERRVHLRRPGSAPWSVDARPSCLSMHIKLVSSVSLMGC